jgi:hypothetical protein
MSGKQGCVASPAGKNRNRDWTPLVGKTICKSCWDFYRLYGALPVRSEDGKKQRKKSQREQYLATGGREDYLYGFRERKSEDTVTVTVMEDLFDPTRSLAHSLARSCTFWHLPITVPSLTLTLTLNLFT